MVHSIGSDLGEGTWITINLGFIPRPWFSPTTCYRGRGDLDFLLLSTKIEVDKCGLFFSTGDIKKGGEETYFGWCTFTEYKKGGLSFSAKQNRERGASILLHSQVTMDKRESRFAHLQKAGVKTGQGHCGAWGLGPVRGKCLLLPLTLGFSSRLD